MGQGFKAGVHYVRGLIWTLFGLFIMFSQQMLGEDFFKDSAFIKGPVKWVVGILFVLYGIFRMYRGYTSSQKAQDDDE